MRAYSLNLAKGQYAVTPQTRRKDRHKLTYAPSPSPTLENIENENIRRVVVSLIIVKK